MLLVAESQEERKENKFIFSGITELIVKAFNHWNVKHYKKLGKRIWDLSAAIPIFLFVLPLMAFIGILIKLDSKGPVLFTQKRLGKDGIPFDVFKFRTMKTDCYFNSATTSANDPRITRVGKFIRPISLDELPQIINIVKGDMSFIGPRPISMDEFEMVKSIKDFPEELIEDLVPKVRPGILGLAIFYGREKISYKNRCRLNKKYEDNLSLLFDSYISWMTMKKYWFTYLVVISLFLIIPLSLLALI